MEHVLHRFCLAASPPRPCSPCINSEGFETCCRTSKNSGSGSSRALTRKTTTPNFSQQRVTTRGITRQHSTFSLEQMDVYQTSRLDPTSMGFNHTQEVGVDALAAIVIRHTNSRTNEGKLKKKGFFVEKTESKGNELPIKNSRSTRP